MSRQEILPVGLTEEVMSDWLQKNPKGTRGDAIRDYIIYVSETEAKPIPQVLGELYPQLGVRGVFGAQPPNLMNRMSNLPTEQTLAPQGHPWRTIDPAQSGTLADVGRGLATVGMIALGGPVGAVGRGALGILGRMGLMGGAGAATGAAAESLPGGTGAVSGAVSGGLTGGLGQGIGEATRLTSIIARPSTWTTRWATTGNRVKWAREDAALGALGAMEDVPPFQGAKYLAKNPTELLMKLTQVPKGGTRPLGKELMSAAFQGEEDLLVASLGGAKKEIQVPTLWRALASEADLKAYGQVHTGALPIPATTTSTPSMLLGPTGQPLPPTVSTTLGAPGVPGVVKDVIPPMTVKSALEGIKELTEQAVSAGQGFKAGSLWAKRSAALDEILSTVPPAVAKRYRDMQHTYAKGLTIMDALQNSKALTSPLAGGKGASFDAEAFLDRLQAQEAYGFVDKVVGRLHKGGDWGARDRITSMPRGRLYRMGESATFSVPGVRTEIRGGGPAFPDIGTAPGTQVSIPILQGLFGPRSGTSTYVDE